MKKLNCILLLFETLAYLAVFPSSRAQIQNTTIYPDLMPSDGKDFCYSPECIHTASRVLRYMDTSLDPCDNFYKFACGNIINDYLTRGFDSQDQFKLIEQMIREKLNVYLEKETIPTSPKYVKLIKTSYKNCLNQHLGKIINVNSLRELISKTSGWPLLEGDSWKEKNFQWEKFGFLTENITVFDNYFIPLTTLVNKDNSYMTLMIEKPSLFFNPRVNNIALVIGEMFGLNPYDIQNNLSRMAQIEQMLLRIYTSHNSFATMTLKDLIQTYPKIAWKKYFDTRLKPNNIHELEAISVKSTYHLEKLNDRIATISKQDQANYLMWRAIYQILKEFVYSMNNNPLDTCYNFVLNTFGNSLGFFYLKNNFNKDSFPKDVDKMIDNLHEQFSTILKKNSWMSNETKLKALEKLESLTIARPAHYFFYDDNEIDEYYKNLEITAGDYFGSLINITAFQIFNSNVRLADGQANKTSWRELSIATAVGAQNVAYENMIVLMPAIFQEILFNKDRPQYMNYGSVGFIIGHELSHTVDSVGGEYDKTGKLQNWWDAESKNMFLSKVQCIIDQYSNYRVEEVGLNLQANETQSEDTSDIVGVKVAYSAYEKYMETNGPEQLLPGVNYTQRQLFWISFAQIHCGTMTTEDLKENIESDYHSPPEYRVIGSLVNNLEFARDFQCAPDTKMNPKNKCPVW